MRLRSGCPVLWRDPSTLQVGIANPLVMSELCADEAAFIASLEDSPVPISRAQTRRFAVVLQRLEAHGVLVQSASEDDSELSACVHGAGQIGMDVASALIRSGISRVSMVDHQSAQAESPRTYALSVAQARRGAAAAWTLRDRFPHARVTSTRRSADIDVVVALGAVPTETAHELMVAGQPHVAVICDEEGVTVGPVVVPGITPCTRCDMLNTSLTQHWWPRVVLQLGPERRPHVSDSASLLAGAITARAVTQWRHSIDAEPQHFRIDSTVTASSGVRATPAIASPDCGCGALDAEHGEAHDSPRSTRPPLTVIEGGN